MNGKYDAVNKLLEKECYVIDFLPETVSKDSGGCFFDVEYYLLNSSKHCDIKDRFVNVILKLMCYSDAAVLWDDLTDKPKPEMIDRIIGTIMENHSGTLNVLFSKENVLLVFDWDSLNMSVYNLKEPFKALTEKIVVSEGLFLRKAEN